MNNWLILLTDTGTGMQLLDSMLKEVTLEFPIKKNKLHSLQFIKCI